MSLYEPWMEPGGGGDGVETKEVDPYQLGHDQIKVDQKRTPTPNKAGPTGKYRFNDAYLKQVQDDAVSVYSAQQPTFAAATRPRTRANSGCTDTKTAKQKIQVATSKTGTAATNTKQEQKTQVAQTRKNS
jgi:hypothetical protein